MMMLSIECQFLRILNEEMRYEILNVRIHKQETGQSSLERRGTWAEVASHTSSLVNTY